jgi:uncharacterized protein
VLFALLYWTYRNRERLGAGGRYARDPVCGMQVEIAHAPACIERNGERVYFCSDHCADRFAQRAVPNGVPVPGRRSVGQPDNAHDH